MGSLYSHQDVVFNMGRFMNAGAGCAADANGGFFAKQGAAIYHGTIGPVGFWRGAESGDDNYMRFGSSAMSGMDTIARFHFDGLGGGYMMGSAVDSNGNITFAAGSTAILNASLAATPEPAGFLLGGVSALIGTGALRRRGRPDSTLGLMALGAGGIRARRESAAAA